MKQAWRLVLASTLTAQAPVPHVTFTQDEWHKLSPSELGQRLLGRKGARITHRRHCAMVEGTSCNGFSPGTIILSTDFQPSGFKDLCEARQWTTHDRLPRQAGRLRLAEPQPSTAFRVASSCAGQANRDTYAGEFTILTKGAPATAALAWKVLQTARQGRMAVSRRAVPVDCRPAPIIPADLCNDPANALAETKLANIHRVITKHSPGGRNVLRLELWGHDSKRDNATYLWVNLDLARDFDTAEPATIRCVTIEEYAFVD